MKINRQNHRVIDGTVILFFNGSFSKQQSERNTKCLIISAETQHAGERSRLK